MLIPCSVTEGISFEGELRRQSSDGRKEFQEGTKNEGSQTVQVRLPPPQARSLWDLNPNYRLPP